MTPAFIRRVVCGLKGHPLAHVRNIYGDEINFSGGNRSLWRCAKCGALKLRPELHRAAAKGTDGQGGAA
jgi:hypothetical protein